MLWSQKVLVLVVLLVGAVSCAPYERVVNGTSTSIEKYPFMVSLRGPSGSHSCGSSIIAPRWILTAAHCVDGRTPKSISIQYGSTVISAKSPNVAAVKRIIMHERYTPAQSYANDIALVELEGQLVYNYKNIAPVILPIRTYEVSQTQYGSPGVLAGWGLNATGGYIQGTLQEVDLKIYSDDECRERHKGATTKDHICAGADKGGKGQCSGDSGGPLIYGGYMQVGIVSWSIKPCAVYPYPGVYTKVSHYVDWINKHIS